MSGPGGTDQKSNGVRKDEPKAMDCFYKAAAKGNLLAEYNLGEIFAEGKVGVKVDLEAAKKWCRWAQKIKYKM